MNASNLYYAMSLAAFVAALWFGGRNSRREAIDSATTALVGTQTGLITAQAERIALLEQDKKDMNLLIQKQGSRIEYLEELLLGGEANVVGSGSLSVMQRAGRRSGAAHPAPEGNRAV